MNTVAAAIVGLLEDLLPLLSQIGNSTIDKIIAVLIQLIPVIVATEQALVAPVQNIIKALSSNPGTTAEQLATLQALDAQCDAAFDAAAAAASGT